MLAAVDSMIRFRRNDLPAEALQSLRKALTFPNPARIAAKKFGKAAWRIPATIDLLEEDVDGEGVAIPRGAVGELRRVASEAGTDLRFENRLALFEADPHELDVMIPNVLPQKSAKGTGRRAQSWPVVS